MNIIIADDEYYARKALVQAVKEWDDSVHVLEAQNGQEALAILERESVDFIFTDIRMPLLDGLQLSRHVSERFGAVVNVIVSGYDDFQYAQQAMRYGVKQYLLKPAERAEVTELLDRARAKLNDRKLERIRLRLAEAIYGEAGLKGRELASLGLANVKAYAAVAVQAEGRLKLDMLEKLAEEALSDQPLLRHYIRDSHNTGRAAILLIAERLEDADRLWSCKGLLRQIRQRYIHGAADGEPVSIGISRTHDKAEHMHEAFREAENAMLLRLVHEQGELVFDSSEWGSRASADIALLLDLLPPLYNKMTKFQTEEAGNLVCRIFQLCAEQKQPIHIVRDVVGRLLSILNAVIETFNSQSSHARAYLEPAELTRFFTWREIAAYYRQITEELIGLLKLSGSRTDAVDELKMYVDRNFEQNMKLEELAKTVLFSDPAYLSKQFKKRYGVSFSRYLIAVRLKHAQSLLESGEALNISEIAAASGFNDYSYFIQSYKRYYGATPGKRKKDAGSDH